jgi:hypothetical protein
MATFKATENTKAIQTAPPATMLKVKVAVTKANPNVAGQANRLPNRGR